MLTPPAADEQAAMQQKMMKYMMLFMGLMFFKVAERLVHLLHRVELVGTGRTPLSAENDAFGRRLGWTRDAKFPSGLGDVETRAQAKARARAAGKGKK